ncbi:hypothetical protein AWN76_016135 [Rhodothermaceae bacterium RA]|nr:hypothetical protein AWN76_016135 [Rhodothermaceae bacterium RA]
MSTSPHVVLFDLYTGGHHLQYLEYLCRYWVHEQIAGCLHLLLPAHGLDTHPTLHPFLLAHASAGLRVTPVTESLHLDHARPLGLLRNDLQQGRILARYLRQIRPDHAVLMHMDHLQVSLATDLRFTFPIRLSGIYFRPTVHYRFFVDPATSSSWREHLHHWRKRVLLQMAARNRHLAYLFSLDPYAVPYINAMTGKHVQAIALPDGITLQPGSRTPSEVRADWGVEPGRTVALLFGSISPRKGVFQVLDAVRLLPQDLQQRLCLVFAGRVSPRERVDIYTAFEETRHHTQVQLIMDDRFLPESELQSLIAASDVMLIAYQRHIGSSNALIRAAAAQVPILGQSYGLIGEQIRRHGLGLAVDTTQPEAIARGLLQILTEGISVDEKAMLQFARANAVDHFARTLFDYVTRPA